MLPSCTETQKNAFHIERSARTVVKSTHSTIPPTGEQFGLSDKGDKDSLNRRIDISAPLPDLEKELAELLDLEKEMYDFSMRSGRLLARIIPIPLIIIGTIYQFYPDQLAYGPRGGVSMLIVAMQFGQMAWQIPLYRRSESLHATKNAYELRAIIDARKGSPFSSLEGHSELVDKLDQLLKQARGRQSMGLMAIMFYLITLIGSVLVEQPYGYSDLFGAEEFDYRRFLFALSAGLGAGMTLILWGGVMMSDSSLPRLHDDLGLLEIHEPTGHPVIIELPLTEVIQSVLDPIMESEFEAFTKYVQAHVKEEENVNRQIERFLLLLVMLQRQMITRDEFMAEISESFDLHEELLSHPVFSEERLRLLLRRAEAYTPSVFLLIDRLMHEMSSSYDSLRSKTILIDAEVDRVITGERGSLLILLGDNLPGTNRTIDVEISCPRFKPEEQSIRLHFDEERSITWPESADFDLVSDESMDMSDLLSHVLDRSKMIWLDLIPTEKGASRITVKAIDEQGAVIGGRVMRIEYRRDLGAVVKASAGRLGVLAGAATPLTKAVPGLRQVFGLP